MIPHNNIIVAHKKQMIRADVLIDDAPFNVENGWYYGILFDAPHNRNYSIHSEFIERAKNLCEVYNLIMDMYS